MCVRWIFIGACLFVCLFVVVFYFCYFCVVSRFCFWGWDGMGDEVRLGVVWRDGVHFFEEESPWMGWLIYFWGGG